ncbi:hypothetical protein D9619_003870 [Psilocybe cf. subviscida]|uniref:Uncharacterized protein n=1 Tax=Psilocybe cf. subviscida TaxID=2480587 RepID=A0A8H5AWK5_9AGAR|nr:hypothetical protein D9619_003872 [Psilocybe cf. subviscida]KAF5312287.1 hypothetical protein D9619_003870 [Psilocybe cf. subviscida]
MSSLASTLQRALSPSIDAVAQSIITSSVPGDINEDRDIALANRTLSALHAKITSARTIDAVIDTVLPDYRDALRSHLLTYASSAEKWETAKSNLARLEASVAGGNLPQRLRVKAPEVQFTKDFLESTDESVVKALSAIKDASTVFQTSVTKATIAAKKAEVALWEKKCDIKAYSESCHPIVTQVYEDRRDTFKSPIFRRGNEGELELGAWSISPEKKTECAVQARAMSLFLSQILAIVVARHRVMNIKIEKKREVAAKADVEMADGTLSAGPTIQSLVDKTLNARLKKLNLTTVSKKNSSGPSSSKAQQHTPPSNASTTPSKSKKAPTKANKKQKDQKRKKGVASTQGNDQKPKGGKKGKGKQRV